MIQELTELAKQQPILVGGVGTVLTSAALYVARSVPRLVVRSVTSTMVSTISVDNNNDFYIHLNAMIFKHRIPWTFRCYEPGDKRDDETHPPDYDDDDETDTSLSKASLIPGYGSGWGYWNGVFFRFSKSKEDKGNTPVKNIHITIYTKDETKINKFFYEAIQTQKEENVQRVYQNISGFWRRMADKRLRPLDTVFLNREVKEKVVERLEFFLKNEKWYIERGIPYKFCFLLYGQPGTGKTSFIHSLASTFGLDINYVTKLGNLGNFFASRSYRPSIIVIEDIDALSNNLKRAPKTSSIFDIENENVGVEKSESLEPHLHDLLNSLDGFSSRHGMIVAITSNHPEKLDKALIRPGRIDFAIEVGPLDFEAFSTMYHAFYGKDKDCSSLRADYVPMTGARLQEIFVRNDHAGALLEVKPAQN